MLAGIFISRALIIELVDRGLKTECSKHRYIKLHLLFGWDERYSHSRITKMTGAITNQIHNVINFRSPWELF